MTTTNIVLAICLILAMGAAVLLIIAYLKKLTQLEHKEQDLEILEGTLQKRTNELDLKDKQLNKNLFNQKNCKTIRVFSRMTSPKITTVKKSLAMRLGFEILDYCNISTAENEDGSTTYYVSINIYPEKKK